MRDDYFLQFNLKYSRNENFLIWLYWKFKLQDKENAKKEVKTWAELQPKTYEYLNQKIDTFDDSYPLEIPTKPLLLLLITITLVIVMVLVLMVIKWWKGRKGLKEIKGWAKFAMEEPVKLKPSCDSGNPPTEFREEPTTHTNLVYESPPQTRWRVMAQIEEPPILPKTVVSLTDKSPASVTSVSSLNSMSTLDQTSLEYGSLKVSKGPLKYLLCQIVKDQRTADRYSKYVKRKSATENIE